MKTYTVSKSISYDVTVGKNLTWVGSDMCIANRDLFQVCSEAEFIGLGYDEVLAVVNKVPHRWRESSLSLLQDGAYHDEHRIHWTSLLYDDDKHVRITPKTREQLDADPSSLLYCDFDSHTLWSYDLQVVNTPMEIEFGNGRWKLHKLLAHLKQLAKAGQDIINHSELEITNIPYYNATETNNKHIECKLTLSRELFAKAFDKGKQKCKYSKFGIYQRGFMFQEELVKVLNLEEFRKAEEKEE